MDDQPSCSGEPLALPEPLLTGLIDIDQDHDLIYQTVRAAMIRAQGTLDAPKIRLEGMIAVLRDHFEKEESYMEVQGYPALEQHRQHHRAYFQRISESIQALRDGAPVLDTLTALLDVVVRDTVQDDLEFVNWVRARG